MYGNIHRVVQAAKHLHLVTTAHAPSSLPSSLTHLHPLTLQAARRWSTHAPTSIPTSSHAATAAATRVMQLTARWKKNFARLYARRMIELAMASVVAYKVRSMLNSSCEKLVAVDRPKAWQNWHAQDWEETAMASLGRTKLERLWIGTSRMISLALLASPLAILYPLSYIHPKAHDAAWAYALWGIEQAGPTWIKLVQWATTRQDLFSPEFCQYFGKLRDDTEGHKFSHTARIMEEELGQLGKEVIQMDPTPIGSGCIAQVYQGTLLKAVGQYPVNTKVAIKVQHPGIWHKVCTDFYILHKFAKWLEAIPRLRLYNLSLSDTVRQFRDIMLPQLDLTLEAAHLKRFNQDFANDDQISFPHPLSELTTSQILTETFVDGRPILDYTKGTEQERKQIALLGLETTLKMIFLNDFVHGK
jgi:ABC1 atypical kinase-like domain